MCRPLLLTGATILLLVQSASAQPLLDRVLDRVEDELDGRAKPIPIEQDQPANAGDPLLEEGGEEPGYLGVVADDRQEQGRGVRVLDVVAGGPAEQGGLTKGDLITSINNTPIRTMEEMARILTALPAGGKVIFGVQRNQAAKTVNVTLGQRPAPGARKFEKFGRQPEELEGDGPTLAPADRPKLGVRTLPVTEQAQEQFNLPSRNGAIIVAVTPGSPAERAGLRQGAVITELNGQAVRNPDQLAELVASARGDLDVSFLEDGRTETVRVSFGPAPTTRITERPVAPAQDESRLDAIERRLQQLEDRIEKIEQSLQSDT